MAILSVLICLPCASAVADNQTDFDAQVSSIIKEETLADVSTDVGNFTDLNELISQSGNELILDKNYKFNSSADKDIDGFTISKDNYVVDGKGHTVDGSGQVRIFIFTGSNITLKNINIINANGTNGPAAFFNSLAMIDNCSFINNSASDKGGAIFINNSVSNCKIDSTFIYNNAKNGGALYFNGQTTNVTINGYYENNQASRGAGVMFLRGKSSNSTFAGDFYDNHAAVSGGAIFFYNLVENNQFESVFRYNEGTFGGGIFFYKKANNNRFNCDFLFNVANSCAGAIFFYNTTNNNSFAGNFINNSALGLVDDKIGNGGAITFKNNSCNSVFNCDFINNTARLYGGAVNYRQSSQNITFNGNFINNDATYGGGVNFFENLENVVFNGEFDGNSAEYGGAIAFKNGTVANVSFKNNHAVIGGAIFAHGNLNIIDSKFYNNSALKQGGAIFVRGPVSDCRINSTFVNNSAYQGGAIFFNNKTDNNVIAGYFEGNEAERIGGAIVFQAKASNNIISSEFYNNKANNASGGAIFFRTLAEGNQFASVFMGNYAVYGGAIFFYNKANNNLFNSNFYSNVAYSAGGAIVFHNTTNNNNFTGRFVNNSALGANSSSVWNGNGGAITFNDVSSNCVFTCDFINNTAKNGAAVNYGETPYNITFNGNFINANVSDIAYGETVNIYSNVVDENNVPLNNGTLSVIINGKTYSADVSNGTATLEIPKLNAGKYNVDLECQGNGLIFISSVQFQVYKQDAKISAKNKAYVINYGGKYSVVLRDAKGKVLAGKKVSFKLNGKNIGSAKTTAKGVATISLTAKTLKAQKAGVKKLVISFADSNYNTVSKTVKITINKEKTKIAAKGKVFKKANKAKKYAIILKNSKNKAIKKVIVTLKVKGKLYKAKTNSKGKATFSLKKLTKTGKFKAVIQFKGNTLYKPTTKRVYIVVKK